MEGATESGNTTAWSAKGADASCSANAFIGMAATMRAKRRREAVATSSKVRPILSIKPLFWPLDSLARVAAAVSFRRKTFGLIVFPIDNLRRAA